MAGWAVAAGRPRAELYCAHQKARAPRVVLIRAARRLYSDEIIVAARAARRLIERSASRRAHEDLLTL